MTFDRISVGPASSKVLSYHHGNWLFLPLILRLMEGPGAHYSQLMRTGMMATNCVTSFFHTYC